MKNEVTPQATKKEEQKGAKLKPIVIPPPFPSRFAKSELRRKEKGKIFLRNLEKLG